MQIHETLVSLNRTVLCVGASMLFGLPVTANATQVQSALAANKVGISVKQLLASTTTTNVALPTIRPTGMNAAVAGMHLGTNTDIFAVGKKNFLGQVTASEFWVRYTLDATSLYHHDWHDYYNGVQATNEGAITGSLWFSFNSTTHVFSVHEDLITDGSPFDPWYTSGAIQRVDGAASFNTYHDGNSGYPDFTPRPGVNADLFNMVRPCIECDYENRLSLSFLEFRKNGAQYDLYTSAQGFDQLLTGTLACATCGWSTTYAMNLAPVPVPAAGWLLGSGLAGLAAVRRSRRQR